jgi:gas vesicle protein
MASSSRWALLVRVLATLLLLVATSCSALLVAPHNEDDDDVDSADIIHSARDPISAWFESMEGVENELETRWLDLERTMQSIYGMKLDELERTIAAHKEEFVEEIDQVLQTVEEKKEDFSRRFFTSN